MSRFAGVLANCQVPRALRPSVYRGYCRVFGANPDEAELDLAEYPTINGFFTRKLKNGLRPIATGAIVSPADSGVGACGRVENGTLVQAKGRDYSLGALLGDAALAERMDGGTFITLYLAPKDYHRVHAPLDGDISAAKYIPGELWPVNVFAVAHVADLFAVNERIVITFHPRAGGIMAVVLVGATMVGMTRLAFADVHTNARRRDVQERRYDPPLPTQAGAHIGHFEFGSTVILVCSPDAGAIDSLTVDQSVRMGQRIGRLGAI